MILLHVVSCMLDCGMFLFLAVVWLPAVRRWRLYYVGYRKSSGSARNNIEDNAIGVAQSLDEEGLEFERL